MIARAAGCVRGAAAPGEANVRPLAGPAGGEHVVGAGAHRAVDASRADHVLDTSSAHNASSPCRQNCLSMCVCARAERERERARTRERESEREKEKKCAY